MSYYNYESLLIILKNEFAEIMDMEKESISDDMALFDLGADSLDYLHLVDTIQNRLNINFPTKDFFTYLIDRGISQEVFYDDGLTHHGAKLLKNSIYKFTDEQLNPGMTFQYVFTLINLKNLTNLCLTILNTAPSLCEKCGNKIIVKRIGNMQCTSCSLDHYPLPGDIALTNNLNTILQERV